MLAKDNPISKNEINFSSTGNNFRASSKDVKASTKIVSKEPSSGKKGTVMII